MLVILDIQEFEIPEFYHFVEETSKVMATIAQKLPEELEAQRQEFLNFVQYRRIQHDYPLSLMVGDRFELFCVELLRRYFERLGIRVTHTGGPNDKGRDINYRNLWIYRRYPMQSLVFKIYMFRKEVDEFRSVVSDGGFDFGVVVGV
ncbi:hypothetical protein F8M41_003754 [Gigaspora margarita]|uniref:Uncharacterized protein n=1 Tax=Gigaspora margarita TaxID=4874 RepID=A0A8H3XC80_GIGMA|nr:hypothetical protein F8M41_003754 [Gigaspora margarita]